jgi:hypothetical protein
MNEVRLRDARQRESTEQADHKYEDAALRGLAHKPAPH